MAPSTPAVGIEQESPSFRTASEKQNMRRVSQLADEELHVVPGAAKEGPKQFLAVVFAPLLSTQKGKGEYYRYRNIRNILFWMMALLRS